MVEHPQRLVLLLILQIFVLFVFALLGGVAPHFERPDEEEDDSVQCLRRDQYSGQMMRTSSLFSSNLAITLVNLHLCEGWDVELNLIYNLYMNLQGDQVGRILILPLLVGRYCGHWPPTAHLKSQSNQSR